MKKIVFVIESLQLGGAEKSLVTLLKYLDYSKFQVDLILFNTGGVFDSFVPKEVTIIKKKYPKLNNFERVAYKMKRLFNYKQLHFAQLFFKFLRPKLKMDTTDYDIAIAYNQGFSTYFTALFINAKLKFAWINTDYKKAGYKIQFDYFYYTQFHSLVAVSEISKDVFNNELKINGLSLPILVIQDIIDKDLLYCKSQERLAIEFSVNSINIVTVGRLSKHKGLHLAIESCKKLLEKGYDIYWYLVGEGAERNKLTRLIDAYGLKDKFILVGMTDNPYPYIKQSTIYVQTSLFEGLGLSVIEASYLNKPIVTTNFPTAFSILEDGITGLIATMDADSIVEKIEMYINNKELLEKLVDNLSKKEDINMLLSLNKVNLLLDLCFY